MDVKVDVEVGVEIGSPLSEEQAFRLAISEAKNAFGHCSPNPPVGCVILDNDGTFLSSGFTQPPGQAHAEIHAIENLPKNRSKENLQIFVTLEPCSHHGKTPPCSATLAQLKPAKVIYGMRDPNPLVDGKGIEELKACGTEVRQVADFECSFKRDLERLMEVFLFNIERKQPFVSLKFATSMDGFIGLKNGESKWITGERARKHAHYIRSKHDGILVGVNTFLVDDPSLDVRHGPFAGKDLQVVILDPKGRCFPKLEKSKLYKAHDPENIWVVGEADVADTHGVHYIKMSHHGSGRSFGRSFDLARVLQRLYSEGISSLLVEGGAMTANHFLKQSMVQRIYHYMAPVYIGGQSGKAVTGDLQISSLKDKLCMAHPQLKKLSPDLLVTGRVAED